LRTDRTARQEKQLAFVTGKKMIYELIEQKAPIQTIFIEEGELVKTLFYETIEVTHAISKKITGLASPEPISATIAIPPYEPVLQRSYVLVLDGISDPGNLGTLLRTALALGWEGVYLTENTCDPFHEKALRAAKGATFSLPMQKGSWEEFAKKSSFFHTFVADMQGSSIKDLFLPEGPIALVLSRESSGARTSAKNQFQTVCIPMQEGMESLNVASAGAILLYGLKR
jgi:RNA methyltransferase, TrmH family